MLYIVSYDISTDRVRNKIAKLLEGYGVRVQYSVFECRITEKRYRKLYQEIFKLTEQETEGSVRFYTLCKSCESKVVTIGKPINNLVRIEENVIIV